MPRFYCPAPLARNAEFALPEGAARHVQVLRMQPGMMLTLFNGEGGEHEAEVLHMGKREVRVRVLAHHAREVEAARAVHLAVGMPANERMDWLVEKATELGVTRITPLQTQRSVLRLSGERALKKQAHWRDIAAAACEQCGRNRVPEIDLPVALDDWLEMGPGGQASDAVGVETSRFVLSLHASTQLLRAVPLAERCVVLNGPEGGLTDAEDALARSHGFVPVTLGERVLRAETAALAVLGWVVFG